MRQARRRLSPGCGGGHSDAYCEVAKKQRRTHGVVVVGCCLFSSAHYRSEATNESSFVPLRRHPFLSHRAATRGARRKTRGRGCIIKAAAERTEGLGMGRKKERIT